MILLTSDVTSRSSVPSGGELSSRDRSRSFRVVIGGGVVGGVKVGVIIGFRLRVLGDLVSPAIARSNPVRYVFLIYVTLPLLRRNGSV
jgi:hypothetical protein